jgi:hypothetical protein
MCFSNPRFQAPSIRASLDPVAGAKDVRNVIQDKPREGNTDPLNLARPKIPDPAPPIRPQSARAPDAAPLKRRNSSGIAVPAGSTLLSGPSGVAMSQLTLGSQTLLGGG